MNNSNHILIAYPDEDLFEDGQLDNTEPYIRRRLTEVEYKILQMWRNDKIVVARWEELNG